MERIKKEFIGKTIRVRKPVSAKVVIEDDPELYAYYKGLKLDIFEEVPTRTKKEKFPKNEPKDNEVNSEHGSTNADGEDDA